jgi:hypothetical protein
MALNGFRSTGHDIYRFYQNPHLHYEPPPPGVAQPYGWGYSPPVIQMTTDDVMAVNPLSVTEPSQRLGLPQSHGDPNTTTNRQEAFAVGHPTGQNGNTIPQAMAAMRGAIERGSAPGVDDLVRFLQQETGSYTCLCFDKGFCGKRFERRHRAVDHVRGHFGLRAYPCRGGCGKQNW